MREEPEDYTNLEDKYISHDGKIKAHIKLNGIQIKTAKIFEAPICIKAKQAAKLFFLAPPQIEKIFLKSLAIRDGKFKLSEILIEDKISSMDYPPYRQ